MNGAFHIGGIGLSTQQRALDVIANNIANLNTQGFKKSNIKFSEIMASSVGSSNLQSNLNFEPSVAGVKTDVEFMIDEQGALQRTNRALDIAIEGEGFIELMGPKGQMMLWRGGSLQVGNDGMLMAENGMKLKAMINVPPDANNIVVEANGTVLISSGQEGAVSELGQIMVVRVNNSSSLERLDGGVYKAGEETSIIDAVPGEDGTGTIVQGAIERSNVDLNIEMVAMMIVQRAYSANAQIVQAADQLLSIANNLRR